MEHPELGRFKSAFEFLNELVVHTLDLHYFYDTSERIYLGTLWISWATVPGVADKLEWYLLRCVAAISVINVNCLTTSEFPNLGPLAEPSANTLEDRFNEALATQIEVLEDLCRKHPEAPMLDVVLERAKSQSTREWLRRAFFPCHLFAQVVKTFYFSPKLREYFDTYSDPMADADEDGQPIYKLNTWDFLRQPIRNPVALLRDRLRRDLQGEHDVEEEARSAWLFLALASVNSAPLTAKAI